MDVASVRAAVAAQPLWYHTMELAPGVVTPGWFDLRPVVERMPWPDVRGKRCLDIGTYDGFLAFELERLGAAEVVATDIEHHDDWDFPPLERAGAVALLRDVAGEKGRGFAVAAEALGSRVERRVVSVYDLDPDVVGTFDVVVCGSLLLHLRDPFRALERIRALCTGVFLSAESIDVRLTALHRRRPALWLNGRDGQWLVPSDAAHRRMLEVAGFEVLRTTRPYSIPLGPAHPDREGPRSWSGRRDAAVQRAVTGGTGVPMAAALVRPVR